ncbi:MAG: AMP-binding protein, partial [Blastocatellia bacterium]|nr:AMP-binding protein [Blastocatellia bacterium]
DPEYLVELITRHRITTAHFVPSMLRIFLEEAGVEKLTSLRRIICSGEALSAELKNQFFKKLQSELHNLYGPTEAAVDVSFWACNNQSTSVPIGKPISNVKLYILNKYLEPVPTGSTGELYIGGIAPGRGYLNNPSLTADRFIPDPFSKTLGSRLYKTGDLARYLPDGNIEFLGRIDHQIKIRGLRIELGEIEIVLSSHPSVKDTAVVVAEEQGQKRILAYLVPNTGHTISSVELRNYCNEKLPRYMIPTNFVVIDAMPLSANGKLDYKQLSTIKPTKPKSIAEVLATIEKLSDEEVKKLLRSAKSM